MIFESILGNNLWEKNVEMISVFQTKDYSENCVTIFPDRIQISSYNNINSQRR